MPDHICDAALACTSEDSANWGTFLIGLGTLGLAWAAINTIPKTLRNDAKSNDLIKMCQRVVYRFYRDVESSAGRTLNRRLSVYGTVLTIVLDGSLCAPLSLNAVIAK